MIMKNLKNGVKLKMKIWIGKVIKNSTKTALTN
ncbi:hypothetical protein CDFC105_104140 [Clostridioides difficile]|nr:hypothetical protein CDFC105_104140 [Clostridioides difficile]